MALEAPSDMSGAATPTGAPRAWDPFFDIIGDDDDPADDGGIIAIEAGLSGLDAANRRVRPRNVSDAIIEEADGSTPCG